MTPQSQADRPPAEGGRDEVEVDEAPSSDQQRAETIAEEVAETNEDPVTRREAIEQALEEKGLSEEGSQIGDAAD